MKKIEVEIEGESPLLMSNPASAMLEKTKKAVKGRDYEKEAEDSAYWSSGKKKELIIPAMNVYAMMINASTNYKYGKKSAKSLVAGTIRIAPDEIPLGTNKYDIDMRSAVNRMMGRIMVARACIKNWKAKFDIVYNDEYFPSSVAEKLLYDILKEAGIRYGLMSYRPQKGGWFGTFKISKWKT